MSFRRYIYLLSYLVLIATVYFIMPGSGILAFVLSFLCYQLTWKIVENNKLWFLVPFQFSVLLFFLLRPLTYCAFGGASYSKLFNLNIDKLLNGFWLLIPMQILVVLIFTGIKMKATNIQRTAGKMKVTRIWLLFVILKISTNSIPLVPVQVLDSYISVMMILIALSPYLILGPSNVKIFVYITSILLEVYLGNKGGLYTVGMLILFELYIHNYKVSLAKMMLAVTVLVVLGFSTFFIGSGIRSGLSMREGLENIPDIIAYSGYYGSSLFERVGYLDVLARFYFDNRDYSEVFNLQFYLTSIIDNLPLGVDLNNNLRVSTALHFIVHPNSGEYFSEIITLPAEMYNLFGLAFVLPLLLFLFLIKSVLRITPDVMVFSLALAFDRFVFLSFGLDWMLELVLLLLFWSLIVRLKLC